MLEPSGVWADIARKGLGDAEPKTKARLQEVKLPADASCSECGYSAPGHDWECSKVPKDAARPTKQSTLRERPPEILTLHASPGIVGEGKQLPGMAEWLAKQRKKG